MAGYINYTSGIARVLEMPQKKMINQTIPVLKFRVQFPTYRRSCLVTLIFWGKLAKDVEKYYRVNDYILIEGYLSFKEKKISNLTNKIQKKLQITVLKVYPLILSSSKLKRKR